MYHLLQVDFYIDKNMIHIADTKVDRRYGDFFIRQIHKFEELKLHVPFIFIDNNVGEPVFRWVLASIMRKE